MQLDDPVLVARDDRIIETFRVYALLDSLAILVCSWARMTREIVVMCRHTIGVPVQLSGHDSGELNANLRSQSLAQVTLESRPCALFYSDEKV